MANWTIKKLLDWIVDYFMQKEIDSPRLSAEMLLAFVLGMKRIELYMYFDKLVEADKLAELRSLTKRCGTNEPLAYLIGKTEFYSLEILLSPDCLIPRPETELLAERAIEFLRSRNNGQYVCELCTGSGCVTVAVAKNVKPAKIIATDISDAALNMATKNVELHNLGGRIELLCGDLFKPIISGLDVAVFDLIVCNPPYVSTSEYDALEVNVKDYEPKLALHAGVDGLNVYKRIIEKAGEHLKPDGALMMEIGYSQAEAVTKLLKKASCFSKIKIEKDNSDNDRIAIAIK